MQGLTNTHPSGVGIHGSGGGIRLLGIVIGQEGLMYDELVLWTSERQ